MNAITLVIITVILLAVIGLLIGVLLVFAGHKFHVEVDEREAAVREVLPGNNCGACGYPGCDGCAAAIVKGEAPVNACPVGGAPVAEKIGNIMGVAAEAAEKKVAFVKCAGDCTKAHTKGAYVGIKTCTAAAALPGKGDKMCQQGCLGLGECVSVCEFDAIHIVDGIAKVDRDKCVACGRCAKICPQHLIEIIPDKSKYAVECANTEKGKLVKELCDTGCIGCGICAKMCKFDAVHVENNVAHIDYEKCMGCGACAAKCPSKVITLREQ
jgi:RnfABCDGE-type electron transport complex B subunit